MRGPEGGEGALIGAWACSPETLQSRLPMPDRPAPNPPEHACMHACMRACLPTKTAHTCAPAAHLYAQHLVLQVQVERTEAGDVLLPTQLLHVPLGEGLAARRKGREGKGVGWMIVQASFGSLIPQQARLLYWLKRMQPNQLQSSCLVPHPHPPDGQLLHHCHVVPLP